MGSVEALPKKPIDQSKKDELKRFGQKMGARQKPGMYLLNKFERKTKNRRYEVPSPEQAAVVAGFSPYGADRARPLVEKQLGAYNVEESLKTPQINQHDVSGLAINWDRLVRSDQNIEQGGITTIDQFFSYYDKEFKAADLFTGDESSVEVFMIMMNYLQSHKNLDTLMSHSTGAKVVLTFLELVALDAYGGHDNGKEVPDLFKELFAEMNQNGYDSKTFLENLLGKVKVIQFLRGNADITDFTSLHPQLLDLFNKNGIKIFNYYHPEDYVLKAAQVHNSLSNTMKLLKLKKGDRATYTPIGTVEIPPIIYADPETGESKRIMIESSQLQEKGFMGHVEAFRNPETMKLVLIDRQDAMDSKDSGQQDIAA